MDIETQAATAYLCKNCAAALSFDSDKQKFVCEFCLSEFDEAELECSDSAEKAREKERAGEEFCSHMNEYYCENCGAQIMADEETAAHFCAFCHSPVILFGKLSGQLRPDRIIPFAFGRDEAVKRLTEYAKKKKFIPRDFFTKEQMDKIQGVYYPFWVTDADTECSAVGTGKKLNVWRTGNTEYTKTSVFDLHRSGNIHFEDIVSSALREATGEKINGCVIDIAETDKNMLEGILPYPSDSLKEFSMPYLLGFTAKKRNIERSELTAEVRERMSSYAGALFASTAHHYTSVDMGRPTINVKQSSWEYALMPVWILTYKDKKGKIYTFAMNGHTGKIYGELPISRVKLALLFAGLTAALTPLLTLIGGVFF